MDGLSSLVAAVLVLTLWACTSGSTGVQPEVIPATTAAPVTTATTVSVAETTVESSDTTTEEVSPCDQWAERALALWQEFFVAMGSMEASELGGDRWLEIDATYILGIENLDFEVEAAGCGTSRSLLCDRLDQLEPAGEVAAFHYEIVASECDL